MFDDAIKYNNLDDSVQAKDIAELVASRCDDALNRAHWIYKESLPHGNSPFFFAKLSLLSYNESCRTRTYKETARKGGRRP